MNSICIVECPRDAMQGIKNFIPTSTKIKYLNLLLEVGFDILDCGSFVSAKAIPQMQDTAEIIPRLNIIGKKTKLLVIVANFRGAEDACQFDEISYLGFPFSVSEEFQKRNTNSSREESLKRVEEILNVCEKKNKKLVVYLSMAFGNPYGELWSPEIVVEWACKLKNLGVNDFKLADTIGCSNPENIKSLYKLINKELQNNIVGVHLHSTPYHTEEKIAAAWESGCTVFDSALLGFGGCPMAKEELTGNVATEILIDYFENKKKLIITLDKNAYYRALEEAKKIFL
ncbi:MAG: hydroxymethylglutaryl-CoA lyase [Bacteroidia bacterium]|nr:hydroxymethylglutaryl-CoA lyase [Bacteroidia bacterium]